MYKILLFATLATLSSVLARADTIQFVGVPTGVNDGVYYVTPYEIKINGVSQLVTCYDTLDDVNFGDTWEANILTVDQAAATGYFAGTGALNQYQRVAWLAGQSYSNQAQQVGLQHAIWNVFGSAPSTPEAVAYEEAADIAQTNAFAGYDFSGFRFVNQVGAVAGASGTEQGFVFELSPNVTNSAVVAIPGVPEPGSFSLWLCGVALVAVWRYRPQVNRSAALGKNGQLDEALSVERG